MRWATYRKPDFAGNFRDYFRIGGYPTGTTRMRLPDPQRPFASLG
jgi:hypothetical protein